MRKFFSRLMPFLLFSIFFLPAIIRNFGNTQATIDIFNNPLNYCFSILQNTVIFIFAALSFFKLDKKKLEESGLQRPAKLHILLLPLYLFLLTLISLGTSYIISKFSPELINTNQVPFKRPELTPLLFVSMLSVGYMEEFFFRGYWLASLEDWMPEYLAIFLSCAFFAIGHAYQGWAAIPGTFILALYFVWLRKRTDSIHIPALTHAFYDFTVVLLTLS